MRPVCLPTGTERPDLMNKQTGGPVEILFYYREECDLCEQMDYELRDHLADFYTGSDIRVTMRDVDDDRQWHREYSEYVPALVINGERVCHYFFDCDAVRLALQPEYPRVLTQSP